MRKNKCIVCDIDAEGGTYDNRPVCYECYTSGRLADFLKNEIPLFNADIIFTGGRNFKDRKLFESVWNVLDSREFLDIKVAVGCAKGLDKMVREKFETVGLIKGEDYQVYEANWNDITHPGALIRKRKDGSEYNAAAGPRRNKEMLLDNPRAVVIAFPGDNGTENCIKTAKQLGHVVLRVENE